MGDIRANLPLPRAKPWNHGLEIAAAARRRDCPDFEVSIKMIFQCCRKVSQGSMISRFFTLTILIVMKS